MEKFQKEIIGFYKAKKRMPSFSELMAITKLRSKNSISRLVKRFIALGILDKDNKGHIVPKRLWGETRVLGSVKAGFPSPAEEELCDTITIDEFLIKNKESTYMLKVSGDSMIDAGIQPGDMALVERGRAARNGDIVIAEVDGDWTIKYFEKRGNKVRLLPGNKKYKPIVPREELNISAVVIGVIRKYP